MGFVSEDMEKTQKIALQNMPRGECVLLIIYDHARRIRRNLRRSAAGYTAVLFKTHLKRTPRGVLDGEEGRRKK